MRKSSVPAEQMDRSVPAGEDVFSKHIQRLLEYSDSHAGSADTEEVNTVSGDKAEDVRQRYIETAKSLHIKISDDVMSQEEQ